MFILNQVLLISNLYLQESRLDIPMHFFGGLIVGLIGIYFLPFRFNTRQTIPSLLTLIAALVAVVTVGLIWEIVEFNSETILRLKLAETITCEDTLWDLLFDVGGAIAAWLYFIIFKDRTGRKSSPLLDKK